MDISTAIKWTFSFAFLWTLCFALDNGNSRLAQSGASGAEYFLTDALGNVRQVVDANGAIRARNFYNPYGEDLMPWMDEGVSRYGFAGEWTSPLTGQSYLRARWYAPSQGRFTSRDTWQGEYSRPLSLNKWIYTEDNPINHVDPTGFITEKEAKGIQGADKVLADLESIYDVKIPKDYGWRPDGDGGYGACGNVWVEGNWKTLQELQVAKDAIVDVASKLGGTGKFRSAMRKRTVWVVRRGVPSRDWPMTGPIRPFAPPMGNILGDVDLPDYTFEHGDRYAKYTIVHELGHVWDRRTSLQLSNELMRYMGTVVCDGMGGCRFDIGSGKEVPPGLAINPYAGVSPMEDWAEAFASTIYQNYWVASTTINPIGSLRMQFVQDQINALP